MANGQLTLISAGPSPYGRKVEIALIEKDIDYAVVYDHPWSAESCTGRFNPLHQLPIIVTEAEDVVYDSSYILLWLEAKYTQVPLMPASVTARLEAAKRQMLGERLMEFLQTLIFEYSRSSPSSSFIDRQTIKVVGAMQEIETLYSARATATEPALDCGDIAVATTLLVLEHVVEAGISPDLDCLRWRGRYPALATGVGRLELRPSFEKTRPKAMHVDLRQTLA